jgi:hypothetical protein
MPGKASQDATFFLLDEAFHLMLVRALALRLYPVRIFKEIQTALFVEKEKL